MHIIENYSDPFFPVYTVGSSCNRKYHCEHIKIVPEYLWDSMLHLKSLLYAATGLHNAAEKKSQVPKFVISIFLANLVQLRWLPAITICTLHLLYCVPYVLKHILGKKFY